MMKQYPDIEREVYLESFWKELDRSRHKVLLLDYDGTLAPFHIKRNEALPYPEVAEILNEIMSLSKCRVVIISGRMAKEVRDLLGTTMIPEIWGSHGLERIKPDNSYLKIGIREVYERGINTAKQALAGLDLDSRIEIKPSGIAVHTRGLETEKEASILKKVSEIWTDIVRKTGLIMRNFDGGIELRIPDRNKGDVVREILKEYKSSRSIAYLGDDQTDEDAFAALKGKGLSCLVRSEYRQTAADIWIRPPEELVSFLNKWKDAISSDNNFTGFQSKSKK